MKSLKQHLSYFSYSYSFCLAVGLLLQKFFSIHTSLGMGMFAATMLTAFHFVKQEQRAPTKAEQRYFARYCMMYALVCILVMGVMFLILNAFARGMASAMGWLKVVLWEGWWASALLLGLYALMNWCIPMFMFGFVARKRAEELK
ncbi:ABZJ_00895 family protein [Conchiformibius steedae]|uniref:ABZJ_00895 family protein n=1 Tax=Conchiformibius steedae TaxID=153493 RepID=UPI0026ECCFBD|nr:ABZJ_00895 family protein [Conchiformibius steedae]